MPTMQNLSDWLTTTSTSTAFQNASWVVPTVQSVHILAIAIVMSSIVMLDLRLLGVSNRNRGVLELSSETLPWTWGGVRHRRGHRRVALCLRRDALYDNGPFRVTPVLLALGGINMAVFHFTAHRGAHAWNFTLPTPIAARIAGGLSLFFRIGVVVAGRWIGFV